MGVFVCGRGSDGQLGLDEGKTDDVKIPTRLNFDFEGRVVQISAGSGHTCFLTNNGQCYTTGRSDDYRCGHEEPGWFFKPKKIQWFTDKKIMVRFVCCGSYHTAFIDDENNLFTVGGALFGKLGHGSEVAITKPTLVSFFRDNNLPVINVACGSRHTVALVYTSEGNQVYTFGDKENGICATGNDWIGIMPYPFHVKSLADKNIQSIVSCGFHSLAICEEGVYSWGEGRFGRLGLGSEASTGTPQKVVIENLDEHHSKIVAMAAGGFHSLFVTDLGIVYACGGGQHGQLGTNSLQDSSIPVKVNINKFIISVACSWSSSFFLADTGEVFSCGNNDHSKLGLNDYARYLTPNHVGALQVECNSIAAYNEHTIFLSAPDGLSASTIAAPWSSPQLSPHISATGASSTNYSVYYNSGVGRTGSIHTLNIGAPAWRSVTPLSLRGSGGLNQQSSSYASLRTFETMEVREVTSPVTPASKRLRSSATTPRGQLFSPSLGSVSSVLTPPASQLEPLQSARTPRFAGQQGWDMSKLVNNSASFPDVEFYVSTREEDEDETMKSPETSRRASWDREAAASEEGAEEEMPSFVEASGEQTGGEELAQYRPSGLSSAPGVKPVTNKFVHYVGHRGIVGARCPVFAAIFVSHANDVAPSLVLQQEEALGLTSIQQTVHLRVDVDPGSFFEFLFFLYTDTLPPSLPIQRLPSIFVLADMYLVERLKYVCEVQLTKNLAVDNLVSCANEIGSMMPISAPLHTILKSFLVENMHLIESNKGLFQSLPEIYRDFIEKRVKTQREEARNSPGQTQLQQLRLRNAI
jgi:Regulator of chromosome condensation (RCC1) repeat/BTB/POZ domain